MCGGGWVGGGGVVVLVVARGLRSVSGLVITAVAMLATDSRSDQAETTSHQNRVGPLKPLTLAPARNPAALLTGVC